MMKLGVSPISNRPSLEPGAGVVAGEAGVASTPVLFARLDGLPLGFRAVLREPGANLATELI